MEVRTEEWFWKRFLRDLKWDGIDWRYFLKNQWILDSRADAIRYFQMNISTFHVKKISKYSAISIWTASSVFRIHWPNRKGDKSPQKFTFYVGIIRFLVIDFIIIRIVRIRQAYVGIIVGRRSRLHNPGSIFFDEAFVRLLVHVVHSSYALHLDVGGERV